MNALPHKTLLTGDAVVEACNHRVVVNVTGTGARKHRHLVPPIFKIADRTHGAVENPSQSIGHRVHALNDVIGHFLCGRCSALRNSQLLNVPG